MAVPSTFYIHDEERNHNGLKAAIPKVIHINIKINKNIRIGCLFFYIVGPILHQAVQTNYHKALYHPKISIQYQYLY